MQEISKRCTRRGSILSRACCFVAAVLALLAAVPVRSDRGDDQEAVLLARAPDIKSATESRNKSIRHKGERTIQAIDIPFLQDKEDWGRPGKGISMGSNGEPKSGTTWTERIITELAIHLCGSSTNTWCQMGGLKVSVHRSAPSYVFEMLHADTGELFLHFDGRSKHKIIGTDVGENCNTRGRVHPDAFGQDHPCRNITGGPTRESLLRCMPDTSKRCAQLMLSRDPAILREAIVFRDPRDIVISEHRMRIEVYEMNDTAEIRPFIYQRFETIVSWQFVRWMWHTTFYKNISHIMFYEDMQSNPEALADLASFMGLNSSLAQVRGVHKIHRNQSPHGTFDTYGLPVGTIKYMNATMSKLLPEKFLSRYGLSPTYR